jgi:DNA/RNA-binding domain of Phe-tRNA-synthetase-like protein
MIERIQVAPEIFDQFPSYSARVVFAQGVRDGVGQESARARLCYTVAAARERFAGMRPAEHAHIAAWRRAYSQFGSKPSRYPCSVEALLKRSLGEELPSINALVDLYNAISIEHVLPVGGEDFDRLNGDLVLRLAHGDELFDGSGGEPDTIPAGEPLWADDTGVTCRRWNWRQAPRTALSERTRNAFFVLDALAPYGEDELDAAADALTRALQESFAGCHVQTFGIAR